MAIYRVREPFAFDQSDGVQRVMRPGDLVNDTDPAYKGREALYEPVEVAATRAVETTSAAPGERRTRSKRVQKDSPAEIVDEGEGDA